MSRPQNLENLKSLADQIVWAIENYSNTMFEYQDPVELIQVTPNINEWYTAFDETDCRIYQITVGIEDTDETLAVQITIDGYLMPPAAGFAASHSTNYTLYTRLYAIGGAIRRTVISTWQSAQAASRSFILEGKSIKIEIRKTTAAGTGDLICAVDWGQLSSG